MGNLEQYLRRLVLSHPLREPVIRTAIEALRLPSGSHGLDAGCGIGLYTQLLAEAVPTGHITGLDTTEEFLEKARLTASKSGLGDSISFMKGDASDLSFVDNSLYYAFITYSMFCGKVA